MEFRKYLPVIAVFLAHNTGAITSPVISLPNASGEIITIEHEGTHLIEFLGVRDGGSMLQPNGDQSGKTNEVAARNFLTTYGNLFGLSSNQQDIVMSNERDLDNSNISIRFGQAYKGLPVIAGELIVQMNQAKNISSISGELAPKITLDTAPDITAEAARNFAKVAIAKLYAVETSILTTNTPTLSVYNPILLDDNFDNTNTLVWHMEVSTIPVTIKELVLIDAKNGAIALHFNQLHSIKNRIIYDHNNTQGLSLPGTTPARSEGDPATGISDVDLAYDYAGDTYDFYMSHHNRDSLDNNGMALTSTVRYCPTGSPCPFVNAFWNGSQMAYGNGFASADDVVGHELTHGVTDFSSKLYYFMQSGAINESFSDVWGEFIDQTNGAGDDSASVKWLMGEDLSVGVIRNMKDPTTKNDPDKMTSSLYSCGQNIDNGGVHINSGINNKATYLLTDGDTFNGKTITGIGITKVAAIYYDTQTNMLTSGSDYKNLYNGLIQSCANLIAGSAGITSADCIQLKNALDAVEMSSQPTSCAIVEAPICDSGSPVDVFFDDLESGGANWSVNTVTGPSSWFLSGSNASSGSVSLYGLNNSVTSEAYLFMSTPVTLPTNARAHFNHSYGFETNSSGTIQYDGGVVEYSTDSGSTWNDAKTLFEINGYNGILNSGNPLATRDAFTSGTGYYSSRLDLSSLSGQDIQLRYGVASDADVGARGWFIDDVRIYSCSTTNPTDHDFNADTKSDILWRHTTNGGVVIWLMNGTTKTSSSTPGSVSNIWKVQGTGDFNGDGKADILWRHVTTGNIVVWLMDGATKLSSGSPGSVGNIWQIKGIGDFDGDGKSDILWRHNTTGNTVIWLMNGISQIASGSPGAVNNIWKIDATGDFNADDKEDILWRHSATGGIVIWLMNGLVKTTSGSPGTVSNVWSIQDTGDFDGDGKADILWRHNTGNTVIWLMNGITQVSSGSPGAVNNIWNIVMTGDYNGDSKADILWRQSVTGQVIIWLMNGTTKTSSASPGTVSNIWEIK